MRRVVHRSLVSAFLLFHGLALAQISPATSPDPLERLLAADRPESNDIRLHVTLLRVPLRDAAEALADSGLAEDYWRTRLEAWRQTGQLELITQFRTDEPDGQKRGSPRTRKFRFVSPTTASQFWYQLQRAKDEEGRAAPDFNELLQDLTEEETGTTLEATLVMQKGWRQAYVTVDLFHCPEPESRPITLWPLPNFPTPRFLFRPWRLQTAGYCPVNQPFLLGAQMEPPHDGEIHTGHVLMAFGRITLPEKSGRELELPQSQIEPAHQVQTWTLAIPRQLFLPWIANRKNSEGDAATLSAWLQKSASGAPAELLATAAAAVGKPSSRTELTGVLRWLNTTGFEPGGGRTQFRPLGNEDRRYFLQHGLTAELSHVPIARAPFRDPFAETSPGPGSKLWSLRLTVSRPSAVTAWKQFPFAMEHVHDDFETLELGEADMGQPAESIDSDIILAPGRIVLAGASLKQDHAHVTFARLAQIQSPPELPADASEPESGATTLWTIETPLTWQNRLLGEAGVEFKSLARDLLKAGSEARILAISTLPHRRNARGEVAATSPQIFLGGAYVNTAPTPKGIFFNMRELGFERVGETVEAEFGEEEEKQQAMFSFKIRSVAAPEWRHWGIWQPALLSMTVPRLAGIEQPVFPCVLFDQVLRIDLTAPQVVGVVRTSGIGGAAKSQTPHLRWIVARRDGDGPGPPGREVSHPFASYIDNPRTVQALVVGKAPADPLSASQLLEQIRDEKLPVLDLITLRVSGSRKASATTGHDFYFPNARGGPRDSQREDSVKDTAAMPEGTWFSNQVRLENRVVGFQLRVDGSEWHVTREARPPEIITDTFQDARLEWPWPDSEKLPPVTVSVQRPIFSVQEAQGDIPPVGQATVTRLSEDAVLILRTLN